MSAGTVKFIIKTGLLTLIIYVIAIVLFSTVLKPFYLAVFPLQLLLIAGVTTIGHLWILKASTQNTVRFTTAFMGSATLKLMVYLIFILVYLWIDRSQVISFTLNFIVLYIIYTLFEVIEVLNFIKK